MDCDCEPEFLKTGFSSCGLDVIVGSLKGTWRLSSFDLVATGDICEPKRFCSVLAILQIGY